MFSYEVEHLFRKQREQLWGDLQFCPQTLKLTELSYTCTLPRDICRKQHVKQRVSMYIAHRQTWLSSRPGPSIRQPSGVCTLPSELPPPRDPFPWRAGKYFLRRSPSGFLVTQATPSALHRCALGSLKTNNILLDHSVLLNLMLCSVQLQ